MVRFGSGQGSVRFGSVRFEDSPWVCLTRSQCYNNVFSLSQMVRQSKLECLSQEFFQASLIRELREFFKVRVQ